MALTAEQKQKKCEYNRKYRDSNPEKMREYDRARKDIKRSYYETNKEKILKVNQAWYAANRTKRNQKSDEWYATHGELMSRKRADPQRLYKQLIHNANRRRAGIDVLITFEEWKSIVSNPCFYCDGQLPIKGSGVDRIDLKIGYVLDNVRPCCKACNIAKSSMTESEFKAWVIRIHNNWAAKVA